MDHGHDYSNFGTFDSADQTAADANVIPVVVTQYILWPVSESGLCQKYVLLVAPRIITEG